jgi:hypothetical protein
MGVQISAEQASEIVAIYRSTVRQIANGWKILGANIYVLDPKNKAIYDGSDFGRRIKMYGNTIELPSGRKLIYEDVRWSHEHNSWVYGRGRKLYSSLVMENICQAIARDVMVHALLKIDEKYSIVMHTHDDIKIVIPDQSSQRGEKNSPSEVKSTIKQCSEDPIKQRSNDLFRHGFFDIKDIFSDVLTIMLGSSSHWCDYQHFTCSITMGKKLSDT